MSLPLDPLNRVSVTVDARTFADAYYVGGPLCDGTFVVAVPDLSHSGVSFMLVGTPEEMRAAGRMLYRLADEIDVTASDVRTEDGAPDSALGQGGLL